MPGLERNNAVSAKDHILFEHQQRFLVESQKKNLEKFIMSQSQINSASRFTVSQTIDSASATSVSEYTENATETEASESGLGSSTTHFDFERVRSRSVCVTSNVLKLKFQSKISSEK